MVLPDEQLADLVVKAGLADAAKITTAFDHVKRASTTLEEALLEKGIVSDEQLGQIVAGYLKLPFVNLAKASIPEDCFSLIPPLVARKQKAVAFYRGPEGVKVALSTPPKAELLELLAKKTNSKILPHYATFTDIQNTLHLFKKDLQVEVDNLLKQDIGRPTTISDDPPVAT